DSADLLLRSTLVLAAAWIAAAAIRKTGGAAAMRHVAWLLGFAGLALLPLLAKLVPTLPLPVLPAEAILPVGAPSDQAIAQAAAAPAGLPAATIFELAYLGVAA